MTLYILLYAIMTVLYYMMLDSGINAALKENPDHFNSKNITITPAMAEGIKIFLAIIWPLSFIMLLFSRRINKEG